VGAHGDLVASLGIDSERSVETMRLFTLVSLGAASPALDFAAVAAALQVRACARASLAGARPPSIPPLVSPCAADYTQFLVCERALLIRRADSA